MDKIKYLVIIKWKDPTYHSNENVFKKDYDFTIQFTAGMLVKEDKLSIRIALNIDDNGNGEYIDIPKSLIIKMFKYPIPKQLGVSKNAD